MKKDIIEKYGCDFTNNIVSDEVLDLASEKIGILFGNELKEYIKSYGYLGIGAVEFYGLNSKQNLDSDLVKQTLYLHQYFPFTKNYIAIANIEDSIYLLIDSDDNIYECDLVLKKINNKNIKFNDYVIKRLSDEY